MSDYLNGLINEASLASEKTGEDYLGGLLEDAGFAPTKPRSALMAANDLAIEFGNAVAGLPKAAIDLVAPGSSASKAIGEFISEGEAKQTYQARKAKQELAQGLESDSVLEEARAAGRYVLQNPGLAAAQALGTFVGPGAAIKGTRGVAGALSASEKVISRSGLGAGMLTSGVLGGGDAASDAYDAVMNSPNLSHLTEQERDRLATNAARQASVVPFVIGAATGAIGAEAALAKGGTKSILRTGAEEFGSEFFEEGATKLSANLAARQYDPDISATRGVMGAATLGGILGGGTGLSVGALTKQRSGSILPDANDVGVDSNTDVGAINKAIDSQGPAVQENLPQNTQQIVANEQAKQIADAAAAQKQKDQELLAQQQAELAEVNKQRQATFAKYGGETVAISPTKNVFKFQGKVYFTENQLNQAVDKFVATEKEKSPTQLAVEDAYLQANALTGGKALTPNSLAKAVAQYVEQAESLDEVLARVQLDLDNALKSVKSPQQLAKIEPIHALRDELAGIPLDQRVPTIDLLPKGKQDEQLQLQQQSNAGLRAVSEQGRTNEAGGSTVGNVRPTSVQSEQPGSVGTGQTSVQVGAIPGITVPIGTSANVTGADSSTTSGQAQGQVNGQTAEILPAKQADTSGSRQGLPGVTQSDVTNVATSGEVTEAEINAAEDVTFRTVLRDLLELVISSRGYSAQEIKDGIVDRKRDFFAAVIGTPAAVRDEALSKLADEFGITIDQAKKWSADAVNFNVKYAKQIAKALPEIAAQRGLTAQELVDKLVQVNLYNKSLSSEQQAAAVRGEAYAETQQTALDERAFIADEDTGDQELSSKKGRKSESLQEWGNKKEGIGSRYLAKLEQLMEEESKPEEEQDAEKIAKLKEDLEKEKAKLEKPRDTAAKTKKRKKVSSAVQKPSAEKVPVREGTGSSKGVRKEDTEKREAAAEGKTDEEAGEAAWNEGIKDFPEAPKFKELSEEQQKDWINFGPNNWTKDDVQTELVKLSKEMKVPAKSMQRSFSENNPLIDPVSEEVDAALRGKTIKEALQWAQKNVRNEYERIILGSIEARLRELMDLGVEFSFSLTAPGKQLVGNMLGVSTITPAGLGSAQKVDVILNGAHTGTKAGTNYETLVHELIHAVTQAQLRIAPDGTAAKELKALYNEIIRQFNTRAKAGKLRPFEQKFFRRENNSLEDADELLAWGLTNKEFQEYLASIIVSPKVTLWNKFVRAIGKLLGSPVSTDSALGQLLSISENLLTESMTPYVAEANKRFQSLGKQPNPTQWPNWSINPELGAPVWVEGDYVLYQASSANGGVLFVPGSRSGDTSATARVDVSQFSGKQIPALVLAQMKVVADGMRPKSSASINTVRQTKNINKLPKPLQGPVSEITATIRDLARRGLTYLAFTEDLARIASKYVKSATDYVNLVREQQAVKTKYERRVDLILQQYDKLAAKVRGTGPGTVNAFLKKSTMDGKWAFDPGYLKKAPEIDPVLEAEFKALPKDAQEVVKAVFKHGHDTLQDMKRGVIENINSEYDALIKAARDANDMIEVASLEQKKAASLKDYSTLMAVRAGKPYAPLKRFGNFVVVAKSNAYLQAEKDAKDQSKTAEQRKEAQAKIRELEKSESDYYVSFAETKREGRKIEEQLRSEGYGYVSEAFEKDSTRTDVYGGRDVQNVFYRLRNLANDSMDEAGSAKATQAINRLIADLHLTLLAEQSARQSERRRKNVAGAEDDMMRSFATQGLATAHFISTLHNSGKIYDTLQQMRKEADEQKPGRDVRREYYNEFMRRHALGLSYEPNTIVNKALGTTSFWMLLTNPAYYLQNMTQPFMMSLPYVAGKHDYNKAWDEFTTAYKQIFNMIKNEGLSEESYSKLPADVREAIETLVNNGRIDISLDQDLGRWRDTEGSKAELAGKAIEKLRKIAQDIESVNRVATAVAAYRLEIKAGSTKEQAVAYADDVILRTHGDYSGFNAPRITRQGLGRLATQFRKFQLIQISLMAKLVKDSFAGASAAEKRVARRALGFTLSHTLAMGGVMGFPGFAAIAWILGAAFGDDDEPDNPELTLRKMIGDKALADIILKGAPKLAGVDLSGKLGMGQMLSILPYTDIDLSRAGVAQTGYALLTGATGSLVQRAAEGVGLMADGEYYKGLERLAPAGLSQSMKAARFGLMEGVTLKNGDVVIKPEDISFLDMLSVAIGLPSNKITDRTFVQGAAIDTEKFYKDRTGEIKRDYIKAANAKDNAGMAKARQEWLEMQDAKRKNGIKVQPLSDLLKAPQEQKTREAGVVGGVTTTKSNREFIRRISNV